MCGTDEAHSFLFLTYSSQLMARRQLGLDEDWWLGIGGVDGQVMGHGGDGCKGVVLHRYHFDESHTHEVVTLVRGTHPGCLERRDKCKGVAQLGGDLGFQKRPRGEWHGSAEPSSHIPTNTSIVFKDPPIPH